MKERKKTDKNKEFPLEIFALAVDNSFDHIIITDENGYIIYANKAATEITGYSRKEMIGERPSLWGKLMGGSFYDRLWDTLKKDKKPFLGEIINKRKDGEEYIVGARISPFRFAGKDYFIGIERDITKEKNVDRAKTEFVSFVSHELKTPMSVIEIYSELLLRELDTKRFSHSRKHVEEIKKSNKRMSEIVNQLLDMSRIESGTLGLECQDLKVGELVDEELHNLRDKIIEKGLKVERKYRKKLVFNSDKKILKIIIDNLLSNAIKYSNLEGKVAVKIEKREKTKQRDSLEICVSDEGIGIPKAEQKNIFTKFFRASNAKETRDFGEGLGLYITKTAVDKLGGKIEFESEENKSTLFRVVIPEGV